MTERGATFPHTLDPEAWSVLYRGQMWWLYHMLCCIFDTPRKSFLMSRCKAHDDSAYLKRLHLFAFMLDGQGRNVSVSVGRLHPEKCVDTRTGAC